MKVLVTGASGFVGQDLLKKAKKDSSLEILGFSLRQDSLTQAPKDITHIVHLAGKTGVPASWKEPFDFYQTNIDSTLRVLEFCRARKIHLTLISTCAYGPEALSPVGEETPLKPSNPYSHSKKMAEDLALFYAQFYEVPVAILRVFNIYGPGQSADFLIPRLISQVRNFSVDNIILKNSDSVRDFIYIEDLSSAILHSLKKGLSGVYNVGTGVGTSVAEVTELLQKTVGTKKSVQFENSYTPFEVKSMVANPSKLMATGWKPEFTLSEGLKKSL